MDDKKKAAIIGAITIGLIFVCVIGFIGHSKASTGYDVKADPFGHIYRVSEVILPEKSATDLDRNILVNLSDGSVAK